MLLPLERFRFIFPESGSKQAQTTCNFVLVKKKKKVNALISNLVMDMLTGDRCHTADCPVAPFKHWQLWLLHIFLRFNTCNYKGIYKINLRRSNMH